MTLRRTITPRELARAQQGEPVDGHGDERAALARELEIMGQELEVARAEISRAADELSRTRSELSRTRVALADARTVILTAREALDVAVSTYESDTRREATRRALRVLAAARWQD